MISLHTLHNSLIVASIVFVQFFMAAGAVAEHGYQSEPYEAESRFAGQMLDSAQVLSAEPAYRTIREISPRQECWVESVADEHYVPATHQRSNAPVIVGGVIGGALGHAVGHGRSNKKIGVVVGSVLGAAVGHSVAKNNTRGHGGYTETRYRDVERCKTIEEVSTRRVFEGYDVTYEYLGQVHSARMASDPGSSVQVAVSVTPLAP